MKCELHIIIDINCKDMTTELLNSALHNNVPILKYAQVRKSHATGKYYQWVIETVVPDSFWDSDENAEDLDTWDCKQLTYEIAKQIYNVILKPLKLELFYNDEHHHYCTMGEYDSLFGITFKTVPVSTALYDFSGDDLSLDPRLQ